MNDIYILSGLGADERIFRNLILPDHNMIFIHWISPKKNETIGRYAQRLTAQIKSQDPFLIGVSFGGLVAVEIAKQIGTKRLILISSAKEVHEIPFYYRWAGQLELHKVLPARLLKRGNIFTYWFFGAETQEEKKLLSNVLRDTDTRFLEWAIHQTVSWKNKDLIENLKHIHGNADRILPVRFVKADKEILKGGHLMIFNRADEVANFIIGVIE